MTSDALRSSTLLVRFLGRTLGPDYEVALYGVTGGQWGVLAIANGHITGRAAGAAMPRTVRQLVDQGAYRTQDWLLHHDAVSSSGKLLRCSILFLKDAQGELEAVLTICFDDSRYRELSEKVFQLCHPEAFAGDVTFSGSDAPAAAGDPAPADTSLEGILETIPLPERFNQQERLKIIRRLEQRGVFAIKGSVPLVAAKLHCSPASVYRYLAQIRK